MQYSFMKISPIVPAESGDPVSVVSIGTNPTLKVNFTPLEYNPTMSKRLIFFGSGFLLFNYTSSILVLYFLRKERVCNKLAPPSQCAGQVNS